MNRGPKLSEFVTDPVVEEQEQVLDKGEFLPPKG